MRNTLSDFTTFGIGGKVRRLCTATSRDELTELAPQGLVLGRGSNVLASDDGYDGTVVINRYEIAKFSGETVTAGSGMRLSALSALAAEAGLGGLEFAEGIPGSVGGAVRMNAGAFGAEIGDVLMYADVLRGGVILRLSRDELIAGYRQSLLRDGDTVIDATFRLNPDNRERIKSRCHSYAEQRRCKQPRGKSAGSVFKNPPGMAVGRLIDEAGLKGYTVGGARISDEHANIIVNTGGATARDVCAIINTVKTELAWRGIALQEEIIYIGGF